MSCGVRQRLLALFEVVAIVAGIQMVLWWLAPLVATQTAYIPAFYFLNAVLAVYVLWFSPCRIHHDPAGVRGWAWHAELQKAPRTDPGQWRQAWPWYCAMVMAGTVSLLALGYARDPLAWRSVSPVTFAIRFAGYLAWGTAQAFVFFAFIQTRLRQVIPATMLATGHVTHVGIVCLVTAIIFSGSHWPNLALMEFTLAAGTAWSILYYFRPNVWLLGVSHAFLGTVLHQFVQIQMRIGPFHDAPQLYVIRRVIPGVADLIGQRY